jgi:type IV secretory pathway TrbD component
MHYITIAAILLVIWGFITLDWFKVGFGVLLFLTTFLVDIIKNKKDYK